jgi:mRNA interferase RelE/StbE
MNVVYSKHSIKALRGMDTDTRERIISAAEGIPIGDIKPLTGRGEVKRLRVGKYRVLFIERDGAVYVTDIGSRGDIYK